MKRWLLVAVLVAAFGFASPAAAQVVDKGSDFNNGAPAVSDPPCAFQACPTVLRPTELARTGTDSVLFVAVGVAFIVAGGVVQGVKRKYPPALTGKGGYREQGDCAALDAVGSASVRTGPIFRTPVQSTPPTR